MKKIIALLIMAAVAASCFVGCGDNSTGSGESNLTGNGDKSSSVEESNSAEDESASTGGSTSQQEITLESLQQANLLSNLFSQYDSVVYTEDESDGSGDTTYIIQTDTGYAIWYDSIMSGYYNEFIFFADRDEPDRMTFWFFGLMPDCLNDFIGMLLLPTEDDELIFLESGGGETVFCIEDAADYDDVDIVYTVDSETLVLKTIERMNDNGESLSITTFHYGEEVELPERITAWQGELRTVTVHFLDDDITEIHQVPANWGFAAEGFRPWSAIYLDEACTQPYEYPGDGTDFTVYIRYKEK